MVEKGQRKLILVMYIFDVSFYLKNLGLFSEVLTAPECSEVIS